MKRKSAIDLTDLAIGILVLGLVVTIGSVVLLNMRDARLTDLSTVTTTNETVFINSTGDALTNTQGTTGWGISVSDCTCNVTGLNVGTCTANTTIATANYTTTISTLDGTLTITNATNDTFPDSQCTYSAYNTSETQWSLPNDAAIGLSEYGNWFDIIVIVGIAGLILALIFMAFRNRGEGAGVSY